MPAPPPAAAEAPRSSDAEPEKPKKRYAKKDRMDVVLRIVAAMQNAPSHIGPEFPIKYRVIRDKTKVSHPVLVHERRVVSNLHVEGMYDDILRYTNITLQGKNPLLTYAEAKEVYRQWCATEQALAEDDIAAVAELGQPGYTWHRLPWDIVDTGAPTPVFDEMMSRTSNHEAMMAWIGGLLEPKSDRQQYLYIYGTGQNGKSSLAKFLAEIFGDAYRSERIERKPNHFWTHGLVGARLVCFPDFDSDGLLNSGFFKSLTGDDAVRIEPKNQTPYTGKLTAKFLFLGNKEADITDTVANRRRIIYCTMAPLGADTKRMPDRRYQALLWAEGPQWLAKCKAAWARLGAPTGAIEVASADHITELVNTNEEVHLDMFERWFFAEKSAHMKCSDMQAIFRHERMGNNLREQRAFNEFLTSRFGVSRTKMGPETGRYRAISGIRVIEGMRGALAKLMDQKADGGGPGF